MVRFSFHIIGIAILDFVFFFGFSPFLVDTLATAGTISLEFLLHKSVTSGNVWV